MEGRRPEAGGRTPGWRRLVLASAIRLPLSLFSIGAMAADSKKDPPNPIDAIAAAKSALQSLKASGSVPGADAQAVPSIEAPAMVILTPAANAAPVTLQDLRQDPSAAARAVQSGRGWLVEAMTKDPMKPASAALEDLAAPGVPAVNPMAEYLSSWISAQDFATLVAPQGPGGSGPASAGEFRVDAGMGPAGGGNTGRAAAMQLPEPRENPFLQALALPATGNPNQRIEAAPAPAPAPPAYRPAPEPAQAPARNDPAVDFAKRAADEKYFPQLKRF